MKQYFIGLLTLASLPSIAQNVGIGTLTPQHTLHVQGTLFVSSNAGSIKFGYPGLSANFWELTTIIGGENIRFKSTTSSGATRYPIFFKQNGNVGINLDTNNNYAEPQYALHVIARNKYAVYGYANRFELDTVAGVVGFANSPTPVPFSAGVRGESNSTNQNGIGVIGIQRGGGWGVAGFAKEFGAGGYGAGVHGAVGREVSGGTGSGGYGVLGHNYNNNGMAGAFFNYGGVTGKALFTQGGIQLNGIGEGADKVLTSDAQGNATWKNAQLFFVHKANAGNTSVYITTLNYSNQLQTDIIMVTPNYNPVGGPSAYNNHPIGVYFNGSQWTIFNQDFQPIVNTSYNVQVIRQ
ncbi:MAG: hypothetical protein V4717_19605 [Bacteroidota bacterium]